MTNNIKINVLNGNKKSVPISYMTRIKINGIRTRIYDKSGGKLSKNFLKRSKKIILDNFDLPEGEKNWN